MNTKRKKFFPGMAYLYQRGIIATSVDEALAATDAIGGDVWVVKAQIHAGGRGKGGGVKVSKGKEAVRENAAAILGMQLVTHQTGPEGQKVRKVLVEEGMDIRKELYLSMLVDREAKAVAILASTEGGMDIEKVAAGNPGKDFEGDYRSRCGFTRVSSRAGCLSAGGG